MKATIIYVHIHVILCHIIFSLVYGNQVAIQRLQSQLTQNPNDINTIQSLAITYANSGDLNQAAFYFSRLGDVSKAPEAYFNAGLSYIRMADQEKALTNFIACGNMNYRPCLIKAASIYRDYENFMEVQKLLQFAIQVDPLQPDAYAYLADTYNNMKQFALAIEYYKKSIDRNYDIKTLMSLADTYHNMKTYTESMRIFSEVLQVINSLPESNQDDNVMMTVYYQAFIGYIFSAVELGYWKDYELNEWKLLALAARYNLFYQHQNAPRQASHQQQAMQLPPNLLSPYRLLFFQSDPGLHLLISRQWSTAILSNIKTLTSHYEAPTHSSHDSNVRIGYLSRRFHDYPGTQMMIRLFGSHNRSRMHVSAIADGPNDNSKYRDYIHNTSDIMIDISNVSFIEGKERMEALNLDIIIDYDGMHDFNSIKYLGSMIKPIKLTWLGYAGPTGLGPRMRGSGSSTIDYIIADKIILPADMTHTRSYDENILYLPGSYQPQDELRGQGFYDMDASSMIVDAKVKVSTRVNQLTLFGLSTSLTSSTWLICFNRLSKVTPDAFEDWMMIMHQLPGSILILMKGQASAEMIQSQSIYHGIAAHRILLLPKLGMVRYRLLLRVSDLFLDTRNYNAHTVAADGMSEGLPILTLTGSTFASRVATSLNNAIGLSDLLTCHSRKCYVNQGIQLFSTSYDIIGHTQNTISTAFGKCLFNSSQFAAKLEYAYQAILDIRSISRGLKHYHVISSPSYGSCY